MDEKGCEVEPGARLDTVTRPYNKIYSAFIKGRGHSVETIREYAEGCGNPFPNIYFCCACESDENCGCCHMCHPEFPEDDFVWPHCNTWRRAVRLANAEEVESRSEIAMSEWVRTGMITCLRCDKPRSIDDFPCGRHGRIKSRFACKLCLGGARYAKIASLPQDKYERHEIADRDGWMCALCGKGIDKKLVDPYHPGYLNIDHIIPVTAPDFPGDILSNVQASHRLCNIRKGGYKGP